MTRVTGDIRLVTNQPANVTQVWVRAARPRVQGTVYVAEAPDIVAVNNGKVTFDALPGAALMTLVQHGQPLSNVKLLVPDKSTATLRECIEAAGLVDDGTFDALELLAQGVAADAAKVGTAAQVGAWADEAKGAVSTAGEILDDIRLEADRAGQTVDARLGAGTLADFETDFFNGAPLGEVVILSAAPRAHVTISDALPYVTEKQVDTLSSGAGLGDTADWLMLQALIDDCAQKLVKDIKIPRGTYYLSRGLDLSGLEYGTLLDMTGVTLRAVAEIPHVITLEHRGNYWKARRIQIIGLEIRGQYLAQRGINIEGVQEWSIDARVHGCYTGVTISDTWYGKFSRETIIQDCLTGVAFLKKGTAEINTIGFDNLKINFAVPKSNFTQSTGEASVGIRIETFMGGIDFHTIVIEGPDYGVKYITTTEGGGVDPGLVMFTGAYWENIKERIFDFSEMSKTGYAHAMNSLIVRGNRFNAPAAKPSVFGPGNHEITGNQPLDIEVVNSPFSRVVLRVDSNVNLAKTPTSAQVFVDRTPSVPTDINVARFAPWGNSNSYPTGEGMLYTTEHAAYRTQPSPDKLRGRNAEPSRLFPKNSVTTKPTTYYPTVGGGPNGPVVWGNGAWHMLILGDGGTVTARQVRNMHRLDEGVNDYTGKELHLMASATAAGTKAFCIDANYEVVMGAWGGSKRWVDSNGFLRIGTTAELVEDSASLGNGNRLFDISTGQALWKSGTGLQLYDWFGEATSVRAAGTLAQRPATAPEQMIYFNTDSSDYSRYESGAWVSHVPNATS